VFNASVIDTSDKLFTDVNNTGNKSSPVFNVVDTGDYAYSPPDFHQSHDICD
jgi:hypothetical protein